MVALSVGSTVELLELIEGVDVARSASASSSNATSTVLSVAYQASILRPPPSRKRVRCGSTDAANKREHRVRLVEGARDRELGVHGLQRAEQPRATRSAGRNGESHGTVGDQRLRRMREPDVQPGERAGKAADRVGNHAIAERRVAIEILVGVDQDARRPAARSARARAAPSVGPASRHQALVDAAHAPALAAGEHAATPLA